MLSSTCYLDLGRSSFKDELIIRLEDENKVWNSKKMKEEDWQNNRVLFI